MKKWVKAIVRCIKGDTWCTRGARCNYCLKLMYKLRDREYQQARKKLFDLPKDTMGNIHVHPCEIQSLLDKRVRVSQAYRRWKRRTLLPWERKYGI